MFNTENTSASKSLQIIIWPLKLIFFLHLDSKLINEININCGSSFFALNIHYSTSNTLPTLPKEVSHSTLSFR